jgi:hypothetical protein
MMDFGAEREVLMSVSCKRALWLLSALLASGCTLSVKGLVAATSSNAALDAKPAATAQAADQASLPFLTLLADDIGVGHIFQSGPDEALELPDQGALSAFLAAHPRSVPGAGMPTAAPVARPTPPGPERTPGPVISADPLPDALNHVDFAKYRVVAFIDGTVQLAGTSRITAVVDAGDKLVVQTTRWEPPPNPGSGPDPNSRVHVIAIPRGAKPITFAPTVAADGVAKPGEGGIGVGQNPMMHPKWKAVPNPEITQAVAEQVFRGMLGGGTPTKFVVEQHDIAWIRANVNDQADAGNNTPDSAIWVGIAEGDFPMPGPSGIGPGGGPGTVAAEPRAERITMLMSIEEAQPYSFSAKPKNFDPGFHFELSSPNDLHLGESLHFLVTGTPPEGSLTLSIQPPTGAATVKQIPFKDLASFALTLDAANIPGIQDVPVQTLVIKLSYNPNKKGAGKAEESHEAHLVRAKDAIAAPPMRALAGPPGTSPATQPVAGATAATLEALAKDIAAADWKGQDLSLTGSVVPFAELNAEPRFTAGLPDTTTYHRYEVRGRYPTYILPALNSGTNVDDVFSPTRLEVTLSETTPIKVIAIKAFP